MTAIMITLNKIKAHAPCDSGWEKIVAAKSHLGYDTPWPLSDALDTNGLYDTLWALRCLPEHDNLWRKYAVWCARQVQHLITDPRSLGALDVAARYADGDASDEELAAARAAAWHAARDAARDAAWDAARAAAWAVAWDAAWHAARAVAWDAAWANKLRQILDAGEWVSDEPKS